MRLGVYGGTFNPIHLGHEHLLREMIRRLSLDRALLIPSNVPPHKQSEELALGLDRLAMCRLAAAGITEAPVEVSDMELDRPGKSYTADTLVQLHQSFPDAQLYFLMGEDMFLTVDHWVRAEQIMELAVLCACPRSEDGMPRMEAMKRSLEARYGARCRLEPAPYVPVSSTRIRALAARGASLAGLVSPAVEAYIRENGIYLEGGGSHDF